MEAKGFRSRLGGGEGLGSCLGRGCAWKLFEGIEGEGLRLEAVQGGGERLGSCLRRKRCAWKLFEEKALRLEAV